MFNPKLLSVAIALACIGVTGAARADDAAEEIKRINESIAVLSAQKAELELRSQIAAKKAEMDKLQGTAPAAASAPAPAPAEPVIPVVRGIEGFEGKLTATLAFGGGVQQTVKQGEKIRGGWTITQIDVNSVTLTRGRETTRLGFGTEPPTYSPNTSLQGVQSGQPQPPVMLGR
ncbi:MAG: type IV pilus biogenesis protein PilP [Propionivibrio sp.]|nr:type IV pilus biogenesis protein PilP [Propionivibrio sp.]